MKQHFIRHDGSFVNVHKFHEPVYNQSSNELCEHSGWIRLTESESLEKDPRKRKRPSKKKKRNSLPSNSSTPMGAPSSSTSQNFPKLDNGFSNLKWFKDVVSGGQVKRKRDSDTSQPIKKLKQEVGNSKPVHIKKEFSFK